MIIKILKRLANSMRQKPLNIGMVILLIAFIFLISKVVINNQNKNKDNLDLGKENELLEEEMNGTTGEGSFEDWEFFIHPEYRFSVYIPNLLNRKEYEENDEYLFFVRFEENQFSKNKGVAIGVSDRSLLEEEKITREIVEGDESVFQPEREEFADKMIKLNYKEGENNEARTIVLINSGMYTYSISTTPEQIDKVVSGFAILE